MLLLRQLIEHLHVASTINSSMCNMCTKVRVKPHQTALTLKEQCREAYRDKMAALERTMEADDGSDAQALPWSKRMVRDTPSEYFPTTDIRQLSVDGVPFTRLPILNVKSSKNNTIACVADADGRVLSMASGGSVGYQGAKKGGSVAAQAVGFAVAEKVFANHAVRIVRAVLRGYGQGRTTALRGAQLAGLKIASVSDCTPVNFQYRFARRPRKPKKK